MSNHKFDDSKILSRLNRVEHTNEFNSLSIKEIEDTLKQVKDTLDEHKVYIRSISNKIKFNNERWQQKLVAEENKLIYDIDFLDIDLVEEYNEEIEQKKIKY